MRCFVIMGVSGCGKSSVGAALAEKVGALFIDGDDLHPAENIEKMSRGEALNDADREPWLNTVGQSLRSRDGMCIVGCSALKRSYRERIQRETREPVKFLYLFGTRDVLEKRMRNRTGHFMPLNQLDSQLDTLEPPQPDETSFTVNIDQAFDQVVLELLAEIKGDRAMRSGPAA